MAEARGKRIAVAAALAVLSAAVAVAAAPAAEDDSGEGTRKDPYQAAYFQLHGSNGYEIGVYGVPAGYEHDDLVLVITWDADSYSLYIAPARVGRNGFTGDLGRFGQVSMKFRPSGVVHVRHQCRTRSFFGVAGTFVGSFAFRGEGGYTTVPRRRLRAPARYKTPFDCRSSQLERGGPGVLLDAYGSDGSLQVTQQRPGAPVTITAEVDQEYRRVAVERVEESVVPASAFTWTTDLKSATLAPPSPFSGSASFLRFPEGDSDWSGNLKADFPGAPHVPVAGDDGFGFLVRGRCRQVGRKPGAPPLAPCSRF